jgi:predicted nucleotidyltransferase
MLLDEPTLGLAPLVFKEIFRIIEGLRARGQTILMVEQNAAKALEISDYAYVLELGLNRFEGSGEAIRTDDRRDTPRVPDSLQEPFRSALVAAADAWIASRERLVSIVLFGSVARREAGPTSDVDVLLVAEPLPRSLADRRRPFLLAWARARAARALPHVEWNLITKTPDEAKFRSPLYLDIVEDGMIHLPDGSWYWDLKPDFRFGDVVEI